MKRRSLGEAESLLVGPASLVAGEVFGTGEEGLDEKLLRRLWVLKVYCDVVEDGRGNKPLLAEDLLQKRDVRDFPAASIGVLAQPAEVAGWEAKVRTRFAFLAAMDQDEQRFALLNARDLDEVRALLSATAR